MSEFVQFPPQQLPMSKKTKAWRKQILDWASSKATIGSALVRKSVIHKKINYDLINGIVHPKDMMLILNPDNIKASFIPNKIQHYSLINAKLNVLRGEESKRIFDFRVVITNPNSLTEIQEAKKQEVVQELQKAVSDTSESQEQFQARLEKLSDYFTYEWKDMRELRANTLLNHYVKEYNLPLVFNQGFLDALTVGEEIYQCDIVGGEPTLERLNPNKVRIYKSGYSNKIEDADIIVLEDYWSPGKIIDNYYDVLTKKDMEYIEKLPDRMNQNSSDSMDNVDARFEHLRVDDDLFSGGDAVFSEGFFWSPNGTYSGDYDSMLPYDMEGNIRVIRMFWKSRRKIKKIKYYDEEGEPQYKFREEYYVTNTNMGEEEEILYINEAWEGTKIGEDIYVNMRPKVVQYNRLSNPSRCHFGIIGSIYNVNDEKPFSLVDMMKPFSYLYDAIHDRLNKLIAKNWGQIVTLDLAKVPTGWDIEKWLYFAKTNNIAVVDSFKEGNVGAATGVISGSLNNASSGVINAELGNSIQQYINLLEYIKSEMSDVAGISKQREGQISNRETVGGVERANLQSSHITEWLFVTHDDVKKRVIECFLETAKIALKGRSKKYQYILSDGSIHVMDIDGDQFAESDYGLVVDTSNSIQILNQKLDQLATAAMQSQTLDFSTIMKLYNSCSMAEKQRMIENSEKAKQQAQQQAQQQQAQQAQAQLEQNAQLKQQELEQENALNLRDNETKIKVAEISARAKVNSEDDGIKEPNGRSEDLLEKARQFDQKMQLDKQKLSLEQNKAAADLDLKKKALNNKPTTNKQK
jgi:hypothetical protein